MMPPYTNSKEEFRAGLEYTPGWAGRIAHNESEL